jgi:hypothetical protein
MKTDIYLTPSVLLRMRNVSDKSCGQNQNTHFVFHNFFVFKQSCRLWDNVEKYCCSEWSLLIYIHPYLLTYSVEQGPSSEANRFAASQEIPHILRNPKVHNRIYKCPPPPVSIPSQPNPVCPPHPISWRSILIFPPIYVWVSQVVSFPQDLKPFHCNNGCTTRLRFTFYV